MTRRGLHKTKVIGLDLCPWCEAPLAEHNLASIIKHARKYREKLCLKT